MSVRRERGRRLCSLAVTGLLALGVPSGPQAAAAGYVSGRVLAGTAGTQPAPGLEVQAVRLSGAGKELGRTTMPVAPDGTYRFEGIQAGKAEKLLVVVRYKGVTYGNFASDRGDGSVADITVYETTSDDSVVAVASDTTTVVAGRGNVMEILQLVKIQNSGDRTYTGPAARPTASGAAAVFKMAVPEGAFDLQPAEASNPLGIDRTAQGIATTRPLNPGETLLSYVYKVRVPRTGWPLRKQVIYPTRSADLLIGEGLELKAAPGFRLAERKKLGATTYTRFRAGPLTAGSVIGADIGYPAASGNGVFSGFAAAVGLVAVMAAGTVLFRRRSARRSAAGKQAPESERRRLIEQIARLDQRYEAGGLPEDDYRQERATMKQKLAHLP